MGSLRSIIHKSLTYFRQVVFAYYDGRLSWTYNGREYRNMTFKDELTKRQSFNRLRTAVHPRGDFFKQMVAEAEAELTKLQQQEGIIIVDDWKQARTVTSQVDQSRWRIHTVDNLPRLAEPLWVLVWASTNTDEENFERVVNLVSRTETRPYPWEFSFVFVPIDPELKRLLLKWGEDHKQRVPNVVSRACFGNCERGGHECLSCPLLYPCHEDATNRLVQEILAHHESR